MIRGTNGTNGLVRTCIAVFFLALAHAAAISQQAAPDLVLLNGKIFTSDAAHPYVQALAIRGERITATGDSAKIKALAGPHTKEIDLGGRTVIPGINDAHNHLSVDPPNHVDLQFKSPDPDWPEVKAAIAAAVLKAPKGTFIEGDIAWKVFRDVAVNRETLDEVAPNNPVILVTFTGHAWIVNSAAVVRAGILEDQPDPVGGRYERSSDGRLTGVFREYAVLNASRSLSNQVTEADALAELRETFSAAVKWGITSIQDMSNAMPPDRCVALLEKMPVPIRVRVMRMPGTTPAGRNTQEGRPVPRSPNPLITVSGTKWLLDGTPLEGTLAPRNDPATMEYFLLHEQLTFPPTELAAMLRETLQDHDQLLLHVSAYPPAAAMLSAMQSAGGAQVWANKRVRFEHGDGLTPDLIPRVKEMGVVVVQNPTHLAGVTVNPAMGDVMEKIKAQPLRSLLAAGIPVALGSDGPTNPYLNIMFASLHPDRPSEAITREQAVIAYTLTSAYAEFAEKDKGSLEPGKLADLAVLSQDIFTVAAPDLPKTESVLTMVGGKIVYDGKVIPQQ
jgi:predicted amidohydrolase YtcJ